MAIIEGTSAAKPASTLPNPYGNVIDIVADMYGMARPVRSNDTMPSTTPSTTAVGSDAWSRNMETLASMNPQMLDSGARTTTPTVQSASAGGGGASTAPAPASVPTAQSGGDSEWRTALADATAAAQAQAAGLEEQYAADKAELSSLYQLAETPEEKAQLATLLQDLERQREQGLAAISAGYQQAQSAIAARAGTARTSARQEGDDIAARYMAAAQALGLDSGQTLDRAAETSQWAQIGGGLTSADPVRNALAMAAGREGALSQQLGNIRAEDISWLADTLGGEGQAQQAELIRQADRMRALSQLQHQQQVSDRINQERLAYADSIQNLQGDYRGRGWQLSDTEIGLLQQLAEMSQGEEQAGLDRQLEMDMLNRQLAAQAAARRSSGGGGGGGSRSSGGSLGGPVETIASLYGLYGDSGPGIVGDLARAGVPIPPGLQDQINRDAAANRARQAGAGLVNGLSGVADTIGNIAGFFGWD